MNIPNLRISFAGALVSLALGALAESQTLPGPDLSGSRRPAHPSPPAANRSPWSILQEDGSWLGDIGTIHGPVVWYGVEGIGIRGPVKDGLPNPCHAEKPPSWCGTAKGRNK